MNAVNGVVNAPTTAPAGWYQDPQDPTTRRYWDGFAWTDSRAPVERPTNNMAIAAFVIGIVGAVGGLFVAVFLYPLPLVLGLAALPLGIIATVKASRGAGRKGLAIAAIVLGSLSIVWGIAGAVFFQQAVDDFNHDLTTTTGY